MCWYSSWILAPILQLRCENIARWGKPDRECSIWRQQVPAPPPAPPTDDPWWPSSSCCNQNLIIHSPGRYLGHYTEFGQFQRFHGLHSLILKHYWKAIKVSWPGISCSRSFPLSACTWCSGVDCLTWRNWSRKYALWVSVSLVATCRITIPISGGAAVEARERLRGKYFEQGKIFRVTENIITHLFYKIDALNEV